MASNSGAKGPTLHNAELAAEMRAYNASLTQASAPRQRPGRGLTGRGLSGRGGSAITRGIGAGISPGRPIPLSNAQSYSGPATLGNYVVGGRAAPAASRGAHSPVVSQPSHASLRSTSNPWSTSILGSNPRPGPAQASTSTSTSLSRQMGIGTVAIASTSSFQAAAGQAPTAALSSSLLASSQGFGNSSGGNASGTTLSGSLQPPPPVRSSTAVNSQINSMSPAALSTRQQIVTNWGPDPVGPQCPAHLRQPSAHAAITEMAQLTGIREQFSFIQLT